MGKGQGPAPENLGGTAIKPEGWDRTGMEAFQYFLYNPKTGEILSRTPLSWFKITAFYIVYYSCLAGFWLACLNIFFLTLPANTMGPKWTQGSSLIGVNPGVGLRPQNADKKIDSQMFVLRKADINIVPTNEGRPDEGEGELNADYAARMKKFLEVYNEPIGDGYKKFPLSELGECENKPYGFVAISDKKEPNPTITPPAPCIFVKFNKIWGWDPKLLEPLSADPRFNENAEDETRFPKAVIDKYNANGAGNKDIIVNCDGRYAADKEALSDMKYFPASQVISADYFPYMGGKEISGNVYHSPLVAIKITPTPQTIGQLIHVECRAYYFGVEHNTKDKMGLVQFEVLIKDE